MTLIIISALIGLLIALIQEFFVNREAKKMKKLYLENKEEIQKCIKHFDRLNKKYKKNE